jgi:deoxyadenosine/deoxycytidine kinase
MQYQYITVEGNIGSGKTTLAAMLAAHYQGKLILEQFDDNPFLPKFYENPQQYAFPLELFFLAERYKQLKDMLQTQDMFRQVVIADYLFTKSILFAKVNLPEEEYHLYQKLYDIIYPALLKPELLIYLHAPVQKLQQNIKKRNRHYEQQIEDDYLFRLQEAYVQYIKQHNFPTLIIDVNESDFEHHPKQFRQIVDALEREYEEGVHYLSIDKE